MARDWIAVVEALTSFPNLNGPFAQKRLNMFLKQMAREGAYADDDISLAVVARA